MRPAHALEPAALGASLGDGRSRGRTFEATRLTDLHALDLAMGFDALALVLADRIATDLPAPPMPGRKAHGRSAWPWFRTGFDRHRQPLGTDRGEAERSWRRPAGIPGKRKRGTGRVPTRC